jgi:hypothetical protein
VYFTDDIVEANVLTPEPSMAGGEMKRHVTRTFSFAW